MLSETLRTPEIATYFEMEYSEFEHLVEEFYNFEYSYPSRMECGNDCAHTFMKAGSYSDYIEEEMNADSWPGDLLDDMITNTVLPPGNYLITVCW